MATLYPGYTQPASILSNPATTNPLGITAINPNNNTAKVSKTLPSSQIATTTPKYDYSQYSMADNGIDIYKGGVKQQYADMLPLFQNGFNASFITNKYTPPAAPPVAPPVAPPTTGTTKVDLFNQEQAKKDAAANIYDPNDPANFGKMTTDLANKSSSPSPDYLSDREKYNQSVADLNTLKSNAAKSIYDITNPGSNNANANPLSLEFAQGRGNALQNYYTNLENAKAQEITGYSNAMGYANTQQGLQQQGLTSAAGLSAPQLGQYGQTQYTPFGGTLSGSNGAGVSPNDPFYQTMQGFAQALVNNQGSAIPSSITGNPVLMNQLLGMAKQINPNFNYNVAQGIGASQQSNAALSGTITPNAYGNIYTQALSDYTNLQANVQNVDQFGSLLTSNMKQGGINPLELKWGNMMIKDIRNQLSSAEQGQFDTTFAALKSKVSGMLAIGGAETPSALTNDANTILSGNVPLNTLQSVLDRVQQEGQILLGIQANKVNNAKTNVSGGNQSTGNVGGGSASAGGYNFKQDANGNWVPA